MITFPIWMHVTAVGIQAFGLWKAGDGWRYGWLIAWINTAMWLIFGISTRQPLLILGPIVMTVVNLRNFAIGKRARIEITEEVPR